MSACKLFYCCTIIIILSVYDASGYPSGQELYEGGPCISQDGSAGVCKKLQECPPIFDEARAGLRHAGSGGRCGFQHDTEIVCCPLKVADKVCGGPADKDGSKCILEDGSAGVCKMLSECKSIFDEVRTDRKDAGTGGFNKNLTTEIVCCPNDTNEISVRIADEACQQYENEVVSNTNGDTQLTFHILSGTRAMTGEFPYMAALGFNNTDSEIEDDIVYNCGGALISSTYVLTAAHCVSNVNEQVPVVVRIGSEDIRITGPDTQEIPITRVITHSKYRRSRNYHDIALVELANPAKMSNNVKPVCLHTKALQESNINSDTAFIVIGFGATEVSGFTSNQLMKTANLNLVAIEDCKEYYQNFARLPNGLNDSVLCAMDFNLTRNSDACQGDSGSPLLMINGGARSVMGVTAFGQACGTPVPAIYTSVHSYIGWIASHVWPQQSKA